MKAIKQILSFLINGSKLKENRIYTLLHSNF